MKFVRVYLVIIINIWAAALLGGCDAAHCKRR